MDAAPEPENAVLTDDARLVRWTGPMFALLRGDPAAVDRLHGLTLPSRQVSPNYDVTWAGFDVFLLGLLASTAYFALRRSRYLSTAACGDRRAAGRGRLVRLHDDPRVAAVASFLLCFLVELPLAGLCLWLSYHTHQIAERRILLLRRRRRR